MARQPECVEGFTLGVSGLPGSLPQSGGPEVGDIYKPHAGQPGYWWIVGHIQGEFHDAMIYLAFDLRGEIVGLGRAATYYLGRQDKVGHADIPQVTPEWF